MSGASHLCPSSVRPSFRRRFARPPSVWKRKDASACSTPGEGRWWRSCRRSVARPAPAVVQARACTEATSMATVPSSARPRMRQRKCCCVGAKMGQGDGGGRRDGAEGRCLGRAPLESVEVVTVSETLSLKEKESAPRTCTPQGEMEERARAGNAAIDREGRCPLG